MRNGLPCLTSIRYTIRKTATIGSKETLETLIINPLTHSVFLRPWKGSTNTYIEWAKDAKLFLAIS